MKMGANAQTDRYLHNVRDHFLRFSSGRDFTRLPIRKSVCFTITYDDDDDEDNKIRQPATPCYIMQTQTRDSQTLVFLLPVYYYKL